MSIYGQTDVLFGYLAGGNLGEATYSRGSKATYRLRTGLLSTASSTGVTRLQWYDVDSDGGWEQPALLMEGSRTNAYVQSEAINSTSWTKTNTTVTTNAAVAPDGSTTADKVVEDGSTGADFSVSQASTGATDDTLQSWSAFVKEGEIRWLRVATVDRGGSSANSWFDTRLGAWSSTASSTLHTTWAEQHAGGWFRPMLTYDASTGATECLVTLYTSTGESGTTHDGSTTDGFYLWGGQFEVDGAFPTSYVPTSTVAVTRSVDALTFPIRFGVQNLTVYGKLVRPTYADSTTALGNDHAIAHVADTLPRLRLYFNGASRLMLSQIQVTGASAAASQSVPTGDTIEIAGQFRNLTTDPQTRLDVGGGYSSWTSTGSVAPFHAFGDATMKLSGATNEELYGGVVAFKVARGLKTLAQMRELRC